MRGMCVRYVCTTLSKSVKKRTSQTELPPKQKKLYTYNPNHGLSATELGELVSYIRKPERRDLCKVSKCKGAESPVVGQSTARF
jgi:hypothetical protein